MNWSNTLYMTHEDQNLSFFTCSFWNEICYKIHNGPKNEELDFFLNLGTICLY